MVLDKLGESLRGALEDPAFNVVLHTTPVNDEDVSAFYHWHLEIIPRITRLAGFEWGSGFYINPTPPEEAASFLRQLRPGDR